MAEISLELLDIKLEVSEICNWVAQGSLCTCGSPLEGVGLSPLGAGLKSREPHPDAKASTLPRPLPAAKASTLPRAGRVKRFRLHGVLSPVPHCLMRLHGALRLVPPRSGRLHGALRLVPPRSGRLGGAVTWPSGHTQRGRWSRRRRRVSRARRRRSRS